jgi:acyl-CoA reductase-like NAD-dependent aldehyde dehydrogenase
MTYQSINPYNGKILTTFEELTGKQLDTALETAANCFETWRWTTFARRAAVAGKAAAILRARTDEFAGLDVSGLTFRRYQEFRLWARTIEHGHSGVREQKAGSRRFDRRAGITLEAAVDRYCRRK